MAMVQVPNIKPVKAKGKTYYYHRKTGERLPDDPAARVERAIAINRSLKAGPRKPAPESVEAVIREYLKSPEFLDLSPNSRELYRHYIDTLRKAIGVYPISTISRRHILAIRDEQAHKPSAANMAVKVARVLLAFAMDRELRTDNPAQRVKALKVGPGHRTWNQSDIDRFLAYAPPDMTMALKLGLYTGQRLGDVLKMTWADYDGTAIRVVQNKTG